MIPSTEGEGVGKRVSHMAELPFHREIKIGIGRGDS